MKVVIDDGGREAAGYKVRSGDCVASSVAIATQQPYDEVYRAMALANQAARTRTKSAGRKTARDGISVKAAPFRHYMAGLGWEFVATMGIGTGFQAASEIIAQS